MDSQAILELTGICKYFPGVKALDDIDFELLEGEVHGLLGENGAGKSTLIKILTGAYQRTKGKFSFEGQEIKDLNPHKSRRIGINAIYQELTLFPEMTAAQNVFMGKELAFEKTNLVKDKEMNQRAATIFKNINLNIKPDTLVKDLSIAKRQMVEISRALAEETKVLIMDEPTSSLTQQETEVLFKLIAELKTKGVTIIYISHRLEEIFEVCDRVTVMRDGKMVATKEVPKVKSEDELVTLMVDRSVEDFFPKTEVEVGEEVLKVNNLSNDNLFDNINFTLKKGEILGIGGLVGSKRSEIVETIFGLRSHDQGQIMLKGEPIEINSPRQAINNGFGFISEDRKDTGLVMTMDVKENISLAGLDQLLKPMDFFVDKNKEETIAEDLISRLNVKTPSMFQQIDKLSGGNQQKAIIARWIMLEPEILIMDEPTRGIDVGAKSEIYELMGELVEKGVSIIMISSEIPELLAMSDRIMVMREGEIAGFLEDDAQTEENVLTLAFGGDING